MGKLAEAFDAVAETWGVKARDFPADPIYAHSQTSRISNRGSSTYLSTYGGEQAVDWVMDCVRIIMESASNAEYHFEKEGKKLYLEKPPGEKGAELAPEDLVALCREPNPYQSYGEFIELLIIDLLLTGECFWHKHQMVEGTKPLALYRLAPAYVDVLPGKEKLVDGYEYRLPGKLPLPFTTDEVIHFKLPNPHNPYRGLGIIAGGPRVYDIELAVTESEAQFFEQGTKLSGVLQTERRVTEPVFKKIQRQFASMYSGARNAYKVAVLEQGLKFQSIQPTAAEAQFEKLSKFSRDRIAHMFRVPLPLLGNMENANYKMAEAQRIFDTKTMRPLLNKLQDAITTGLTDAWGVEFIIEYEYVMPDEDRLRLAESFAALPGVTVKEVRKMAGLDPLEDTKTNDIVLNLPVEGDPNRPLAGEGGRPPNGENVPTFPKPGGALPAKTGDGPRPRSAASYGKKALFDPTNPDPLKAARDPVIESIAHQIKVSLEVAASALEIELTAELRGEGKGITQTLAQKIRNSAAWKRFESAAKRGMIRSASEAVVHALDHHKILGFSPEESDIDQVVADLLTRPNGIKSIVGNLKKDVAKMVADGVRKGYTSDQILHGTGEDFPGLRGMLVAWRRGQAETIALTEAVEYYNEGVLRVAEDSGIDHVLVLDGEDWDEPCVRANGEVWNIEHARANRTEHPRCRRTFFPVTVAAEAPSQKAGPSPGVVTIEQAPQPNFEINVAQPEFTFPSPTINVETPLAPEVNVVVPPATVGDEVFVIDRNEAGQIKKMRKTRER